MNIRLSGDLLMNIRLRWDLDIDIRFSWDLFMDIRLSRNLNINIRLSRDLNMDIWLSKRIGTRICNGGIKRAGIQSSNRSYSSTNRLGSIANSSSYRSSSISIIP